jgi:hypothetical protein
METDDSTPQTPNFNTAEIDTETPAVNTPNKTPAMMPLWMMTILMSLI